MSTILVTGCNGYIGNGIVQRLLREGHDVVGIDNDVKLKWLKEMKSISAIDVPEDRPERIKHIWTLPYEYYNIDISKNVNKLKTVFEQYNFNTVINLAQQPAAPYSQIDLKHASWTIQNNTIGCLNLLWMIKEYCPNAHLIEIESMGTYQPDINTDIPEGKFSFQYNGRDSEPSIFPKSPGSFYHSSKVFNTYLNDCANRWWGIKSTIINQGVVYGNYTDEIAETKIHSHLASDESFGTVVNRFIVQAMLNHPLTIYGSGEHKRGFLALNDSVQCLELFVDNPPKNGEMRIVNQLDEVFSMNEIAQKVVEVSKEFFLDPITVEHIESPRAENTDEFYYNPHTNTLKELGFKQTRSIEDEVRFAFKAINRKNLKNLEKLVLPKITWR